MLVCATGCLMSFKRFSEIRPESSEHGLVKRAKLNNHFLAYLWSLDNVFSPELIQVPWICAFTLSIRCESFPRFLVLLFRTLDFSILVINITLAGSKGLNFKTKSLINSNLFGLRAQLLILHHEVVLHANVFSMLSLWHLEAYLAIEKWAIGLELWYSLRKFPDQREGGLTNKSLG